MIRKINSLDVDMVMIAGSVLAYTTGGNSFSMVQPDPGPHR